MNGIQTSSQVLSLAQSFCILNDTLARPLPFGHNWSRLRIGLLGKFFGNLLPNAGDAPLFFGLDSSGAQYGYPNIFGTDPSGVRAVGLFIKQPGAGGTNAAHFDPNAANNLFIDQHDGTVDFSVQLGVSPLMTSSNTDTTAMVMEFTKGASDIAINMAYQTATSATSQATFDSAMAASTMADAKTLLGATYSLVSKTITGAIARDSYGKLNRLCASCTSQVFSSDTSNNVALVRAFAVRRLY